MVKVSVTLYIVLPNSLANSCHSLCQCNRVILSNQLWVWAEKSLWESHLAVSLE